MGRLEDLLSSSDPYDILTLRPSPGRWRMSYSYWHTEIKGHKGTFPDNALRKALDFHDRHGYT